MSTENLDAFYQVVYDLIGMYYDATKGFQDNYQDMVEMQDKGVKAFGLSIDQQDEIGMSYGKGAPQLPPNHPDFLANTLHTSTQRQFKARNARGGRNHVVMGNMIICQLYGYWEDFYRALIAGDFKVPKSDISLDIFGDIRYLRNSVLHHKGIAINEVKRCKLANWFEPGDMIEIDTDKFEFIMKQVKNDIQHFYVLYHKLLCSLP